MRAIRRLFGLVIVLAAVLVPATQAAAAGAITATPSTGLVDGQTITVDGSGWTPGSQIGYCEAVPSASSPSQADCAGGSANVVDADGTGQFSVSLAVSSHIFIPRLGRTVDCTDPAESCAVGAADVNAIGTTAVSVDLQFTPVPPVLVPGTVSVLEGDAGTANASLPVTLSHSWDQTVTAQWTTFRNPGPPSCQADPATDYTPANGTATFPPGDTAETVTIPVTGDELVEPDECIVVVFRSATNATIGGFYGIGVVTITNDDGSPT